MRRRGPNLFWLAFIAGWLTSNPFFRVYTFGMGTSTRTTISKMPRNLDWGIIPSCLLCKEQYVCTLGIHFIYLSTASEICCPQVHRAMIRMRRLRDGMS